MPLRLAEHPAQDRPRERLWAVGPAALTGQELLAILLGTGCAGRDALAVAGELLARVEGSLRRLSGRPSAELARIPGVGRSKAARVVAALELGNMLDVAETVVASGLERRESRGSHTRKDYPERDDDRYLKHTLAYTEQDGPRIDYDDVTITRWPAAERKY